MSVLFGNHIIMPFNKQNQSLLGLNNMDICPSIDSFVEIHAILCQCIYQNEGWPL